MAIQSSDVVTMLADPAVAGLDFWAGPIHITGERFGVIRDHIRVANILVVPGHDSMAYYHPDTDTLELPQAAAPDLGIQALLLHECAHALVDIYYVSHMQVRRHVNECAAYLTQKAFEFRKSPGRAAPAAVPTTGDPWTIYWSMLENLAWEYNLQSAAGNGAYIPPSKLEPLITQMRLLPGGLVNGTPSHPYGYAADAKQMSDGLKNDHPFLFLNDAPEEINVRTTSVAHEPPFDPSDEYLIRVFGEHYAKSDVSGYGGRLKRLRRDFAHCSVARAKALHPRLSKRMAGDKVSEAFFASLSTKGRAILVAVLARR